MSSIKLLKYTEEEILSGSVAYWYHQLSVNEQTPLVLRHVHNLSIYDVESINFLLKDNHLYVQYRQGITDDDTDDVVFKYKFIKITKQNVRKIASLHSRGYHAPILRDSDFVYHEDFSKSMIGKNDYGRLLAYQYTSDRHVQVYSDYKQDRIVVVHGNDGNYTTNFLNYDIFGDFVVHEDTLIVLYKGHIHVLSFDGKIIDQFEINEQDIWTVSQDYIITMRSSADINDDGDEEDDEDHDTSRSNDNHHTITFINLKTKEVKVSKFVFFTEDCFQQLICQGNLMYVIGDNDIYFMHLPTWDNIHRQPVKEKKVSVKCLDKTIKVGYHLIKDFEYIQANERFNDKMKKSKVIQIDTQSDLLQTLLTIESRSGLLSLIDEECPDDYFSYSDGQVYELYNLIKNDPTNEAVLKHRDLCHNLSEQKSCNIYYINKLIDLATYLGCPDTLTGKLYSLLYLEGSSQHAFLFMVDSLENMNNDILKRIFVEWISYRKMTLPDNILTDLMTTHPDIMVRVMKNDKPGFSVAGHTLLVKEVEHTMVL
jgi:hypothetical protein